MCVKGWVLQKVMPRWNLGWMMSIRGPPLWKKQKADLGRGRGQVGCGWAQPQASPLGALGHFSTVGHWMGGIQALSSQGWGSCLQLALQGPAAGGLGWPHSLQLVSRSFLEGPSGWYNSVCHWLLLIWCIRILSVTKIQQVIAFSCEPARNWSRVFKQ